MNYNIYLVEDDINLNNILTTYLENEKWNVKSFLNGKTAEEFINKVPDLWILDIMLPDIDGYQLIKKIKANNPEIPVIFISARDEDIDRVIGLEFGSDDYLAKPFLPRELVIRTKNILDRTYNDHKSNNIKTINRYIIDENSRTVSLDSKKIELTNKEYSLLIYLINNLDKALSRENILCTIWDENYFGSDRVVDDLIRRLRFKMPNLEIKTIYGYGYMVTENEK